MNKRKSREEHDETTTKQVNKPWLIHTTAVVALYTTYIQGTLHIPTYYITHKIEQITEKIIIF